MSTRMPTAQQTDLLVAVGEARIIEHGGMRGMASFYLLPPGSPMDGKPVTAAVERLVERGWIDLPEYPGPVGSAPVGLTSLGRAVCDEARDWYAYETIPYADRPRVRVGRRSRGNNPIRGHGKVPDGRNVTCSEPTCTSRNGYQPVWFTNESGPVAQRDAETAMRRHAMGHVRGEF